MEEEVLPIEEKQVKKAILAASLQRIKIPSWLTLKILEKLRKFRLEILLILFALLGILSFSQYQKSQAEIKKLKEDPRLAAQTENKELIEKVEKLIVLPEGEEPTIATVTDKEKLKNQPFFAKAENGDRVLIYTQAKRAILYRPSLNKVIEIAPINIGSEQTPTPTPISRATPIPFPSPVPQ